MESPGSKTIEHAEVVAVEYVNPTEQNIDNTQEATTAFTVQSTKDTGHKETTETLKTLDDAAATHRKQHLKKR